MVRSVIDIRKDIEVEANIINGKNISPALVVIHLEKAIKLYNELYANNKPSLADRTGFMLLKAQYKTLCAITRKKPDKKLLDGDF